MIAICKEDAALIRQYFPNVTIVRTMRQKSKRHHYYCEEDRRAMKFLKLIKRGEDPTRAITYVNKPYNKNKRSMTPTSAVVR